MTARPAGAERGAALWFALVAMVLLAAAGLGLIGLVDLETRMGAAHTTGTSAFYAADAALERAIADVTMVADWSGIISGSVRSPMADTTLQAVLVSAERIDLVSRTATLQAEARTRWPLGVNTPVWRLFLWGPAAALAGSAGEVTAYVAVWVADDCSEADGDPSRDVNRVVMLRAEAFNVGRAHRMLEATLARDAPSSSPGYWPASFAPTGTVLAPAGPMAVRPDFESETGHVRRLVWREIR